jgi:2-polyprenyl-6-methoxyphenol hydroxylase-like FAD-dependent oxidoreductase
LTVAFPSAQLSEVTLRIGVVGAGIGGLTAAIALRQGGHEVHVFEKTSELGEVGAAISLWPNALAALDRLGLEDEVRAVGEWEEPGTLRKPSGEAFWTFDNSNLIILRSLLQQALLRSVDGPPLMLGMRCTTVKASAQEVSIQFDDGSDHSFDLVVGADGLRSAVRSAVAPGEPPPAYSGNSAWRAVMHAPGLVPTAWLTIGRGLQFLAAPLPDGYVYWSPLVKIPLGEVELIDDHLGYLKERFGSWHPPIPELLCRTDENSCFATPVFCRPPPSWLHRGRVVLIGDAAHPMTPDLGQGACQAIEDAVILADCLSASEGNVGAELADFTSRRLKRIRRIVKEARQLGRLNASTSPLVEIVRTSVFKLVPGGYSQRHLHDLNGREALDAQLSSTR